jgi:hypothetical protein
MKSPDEKTWDTILGRALRGTPKGPPLSPGDFVKAVSIYQHKSPISRLALAQKLVRRSAPMAMNTYDFITALLSAGQLAVSEVLMALLYDSPLRLTGEPAQKAFDRNQRTIFTYDEAVLSRVSDFLTMHEGTFKDSESRKIVQVTIRWMHAAIQWDANDQYTYNDGFAQYVYSRSDETRLRICHLLKEILTPKLRPITKEHYSEDLRKDFIKTLGLFISRISTSTQPHLQRLAVTLEKLRDKLDLVDHDMVGGVSGLDDALAGPDRLRLEESVPEFQLIVPTSFRAPVYTHLQQSVGWRLWAGTNCTRSRV